MPVGVMLFLLYAFAMLAGLAVAMPLVIDQAVEASVSPLGVVYMLLLAYLIFTLTLVLQRKQAGYPLALGLATLSVPLIPILFLSPAGAPGAGGGGAELLVVVADTRRVTSGIEKYFANVYNENLWLFALWAVVLTAAYGAFLGVLMDFILSRTGIDLKSRKIVEH